MGQVARGNDFLFALYFSGMGTTAFAMKDNLLGLIHSPRHGQATPGTRPVPFLHDHNNALRIFPNVEAKAEPSPLSRFTWPPLNRRPKEVWPLARSIPGLLSLIVRLSSSRGFAPWPSCWRRAIEPQPSSEQAQAFGRGRSQGHPWGRRQLPQPEATPRQLALES